MYQQSKNAEIFLSRLHHTCNYVAQEVGFHVECSKNKNHIIKTHPENNPRPRLVGVESDAGPDCGAFDVFLSVNFPNIPDIFVCFSLVSKVFRANET